ncbi:MAG: hypothetical protein A3B68_03310 [Candidatus Melainabacteria bacterium RIFCSPHIGHO2_02_FULL_34_12]|nr:MAG: hypothetical protein A3B68_03310 [Candidatus Melainabacteria bacterium RIFCSPHIGHO2_02_FULL_34_12]
MSLNHCLQKVLEKYIGHKPIYDRVKLYFEKNTAAAKYLEVCEEKKWECILDHLTVRTYDIDKAAKEYEGYGYKYDETIDYKNEGWYAKVYRHLNYAPMFIDQNYKDAPENLQIIKKWVDKFGDKEYHHIALRIPQGIEIEEAIDLLKKKGVKFPGKITGTKGTRLRQIFTEAENIDEFPYSVLELAQRNKDKNGKIYEGFISEQADSLMKDSVLKS